MTRPPGEGRARPVVTEGGPWKGITTEEWVRRVATPATPIRELEGDRFVGWVNPETRRGAA